MGQKPTLSKHITTDRLRPARETTTSQGLKTTASASTGNTAAAEKEPIARSSISDGRCCEMKIQQTASRKSLMVYGYVDSMMVYGYVDS
jgi:hypothetical protein